MPFFFVFVGVLLIITGVKDTYVALGNQIAKDFTGTQNFFVWVLALGAVGSLGYIERLRPFTNAFMVLILLAMVLTNANKGDILTLVSDGLNNPVTPDRPATTEASPTQSRASMSAPPDAIKKGVNYLEEGAKLLAIFGL
jgi:hypothetical protein